MSKSWEILKKLQLSSLGTGEYKIEDLEEANEQIKALFIALFKDPSGDHEIAEGVRQYQAELKQLIQAL